VSLSCSCDFDGEYAWTYIPPDDYSTLISKRRKRCASCNDLIDIGGVIAKFVCMRPTIGDIEIKIHGEDEDIYIADKNLCEKCADVYFSLRELGFNCIAPDEDMIGAAKEYNRDYVS